jgi:tetratricopeptide (TPR) repeat protein
LNHLYAAHAAYFVQLTEEGDRQQFEGDQVEWSNRIEVEYDNIRAALNWTLSQTMAETSARLVYSMAWWWGINKYAGEGYQLAERVLELSDDIPLALRGMMMRRIGRLVFLHGHYDHARELLEESVKLLRQTDEQVELARALNQLSKLANNLDYAHESLEIFMRLDNKRGIAWVLNTLGEEARLADDHEAALGYYEQSLSLYETFNYHIMLASVYANLGDTVLTLGDIQRAKALFKAGLTSANQISSPIKCAYNLAGLACVAVSLGRYERAAHLVGYIDQLNIETGVQFDPIDMRSLERYIVILKDKLSPQRYEILYEQGRGMTLEQAIVFALSDATEIS